jgi:hypothetical protein
LPARAIDDVSHFVRYDELEILRLFEECIRVDYLSGELITDE